MLPRVYGQHLGRFEGAIRIDYDDFSRSARTAYNQLLDAFDAQTKRKEINKYNEVLNKISDINKKGNGSSHILFCKRPTS